MTLTPAERDGAHDFDFWHGHWKTQNQFLKARLAGCTEWETFESRSNVFPLPGGIGNYDDWTADEWRPGFVGLSFRVYSPQSKHWSIYWLENRSGGVDPATGFLNPPVVGRFENGVGTFIGTEMLEGRETMVRFIWSEIGPQSAKWEQAFSIDEGRTWETNWIMNMTRLPAEMPA